MKTLVYLKNYPDIYLMERHSFVYLLTNKHKTVLYIGVTSDLKDRLLKHLSREIKGFTSRYNCYYLVYYEGFDYISDAIKREKQLKVWTRMKKEGLINSTNPEWEFLNDEILKETLSS